MAKKALAERVRQRADGRRSLLVYVRPEVIKRLKIAALEQGRPAYQIAEEALSQWLADQSNKRKK